GPPDRAAQIDQATAEGRLTDHNGPLVALLYIPPALAALLFAVLSLAGVFPVQLAEAGTPAARLLGSLTNAGTILIGVGTVALLDAVSGALGHRWVNLWRHTDPIGGSIGTTEGAAGTAEGAAGTTAGAAGTTAASDQRFQDPVGFAVPAGDTAYPPIRLHTWY